MNDPGAGFLFRLRRFMHQQRQTAATPERRIAGRAVRAMVGVVIPYYQTNPAHFAKCLASVAAQSLLTEDPDLTIIVIIVDDDHGLPLVATPGLAVELVRTPHKQSGANAARNLGSRVALELGADYIAFLDSDDVWLPTHLASALQILEREPAGLVYSPLYGIEGSLRTTPQGYCLTEILSGSFASTQTLVLSGSILRHLSFDETLRRLQDWDFVISVARAGFPLYYNPDGGAFAHLTQTSVSRGEGADNRLTESLLRITWKHRGAYVHHPRVTMRNLRRALASDRTARSHLPIYARVLLLAVIGALTRPHTLAAQYVPAMQWPER